MREVKGLISPAGESSDSLVVTCSSYEDRSTAIVAKLSPRYCAGHAVVFRSSEYAQKGKTPAHFETITRKLQKVTLEDPRAVEFEIDSPISSLRQFEGLCREWNESSSLSDIAVDITTFPRQELLLLLRVLDSFPWRPRIRIFYAEPETYATESTGGWLTRGVKSVSSVPGFGGIQEPGKKKLLVLFLGHEEERAAITWKRHQPNMTVTILPNPSYRHELDGIAAKQQELFFTRLANTKPHPGVPALGIDQSEEAVVDLWDKYHDTHYLVVAPLGTKIQTLGIFRATRKKPSIQITYAVPSIYNFKSYSKSVGRVWEVAWS